MVDIRLQLDALTAHDRLVTLATEIGRHGWQEQRALWRMLARHLLQRAPAMAPRTGAPATVDDVLAVLHSDLDAAVPNVPSAGSTAGSCADAEGAAHARAHAAGRSPNHIAAFRRAS